MSGHAAHVAFARIQFPLKFMNTGKGALTAGAEISFCHSAQSGNLQLVNVRI